jgi:hypothetical protein
MGRAGDLPISPISAHPYPTSLSKFFPPHHPSIFEFGLHEFEFRLLLLRRGILGKLFNLQNLSLSLIQCNYSAHFSDL